MAYAGDRPDRLARSVHLYSCLDRAKIQSETLMNALRPERVDGFGPAVLGSRLIFGIWLCCVYCPAQAQEKPTSAPSETNAPTGTYTAETPVRIVLHLGTNGTYEVQCALADRQKQQGTWEWNGAQKEFRLSPTAGKFPFELRRLRVDRQEPGCLQWIPLAQYGPTLGEVGVIDYVRFRCQKD
jgi:hypothetical protein